MELKDWIIMLVPIILNGVCLFIFQLLFKRKFEKMEKKTEYRHVILKEFLEILKNFYEKFWTIRNADQDISCGGADFSDSWNTATNQIQNILMYYDTHKAALNDMEEHFTTCIHQYQVLIDILKQGRIPCDDGYLLTDKCKKDFCDEYWKMDTLIKDCLKECEQQILQFK